jgi:chaperonin GroES
MENLYGMMPVRGMVVVDRESASASPMGIIVTGDDVSSKGLVVAVGQGVTLWTGELRPPVVKPGDTVIFKTFTQKITFNKKEYLVVTEDDILVIVDPEVG